MSESSWVGLNLSGSSKWSISRQNAARRERQSWCINRIHPSSVLQRLSLLPGLHFTERVEAGLGIRVLHVVPGQVRPWDHELMWYVYHICIWLNLIMTWAYLHIYRNVAILWGVGSWFRTSHAPLQVAVNATARSLTLRPARSRSGPSWENLQWNTEYTLVNLYELIREQVNLYGQRLQKDCAPALGWTLPRSMCGCWDVWRSIRFNRSWHCQAFTKHLQHFLSLYYFVCLHF